MFPERFQNLDAARDRFGDRVDRLGPWLYRVDERADALVRAIERDRGVHGLFEEALVHGIDAVRGAPDELCALFDQVDRVPAWVDWDAIDRGGRLLMRGGLLGGLVLGLKSLPYGYASPGGNKPLVFSGRLKEQAARRLNETAQFVQQVCRPRGLRRFGEGFRITLKVRLMHAQVRRMLLRSGRWDDARWGAPLNQHDMAGTTLLFSLSVLEGLRTFGMRIAGDEAESYLQLWRYVGWLIGAEPELTPASEFEARQLAELIAATMGEPDDDSRALVKALLRSGVQESGPAAGQLVPSRLRTLGSRELARTQIGFAHGVCRGLVGDELADKLGVKRTPWRWWIPAVRQMVGVAETVRENVEAANRMSVVVGAHYWDRVIEVGLAGATAEFGLPERLAHVA